MWVSTTFEVMKFLHFYLVFGIFFGFYFQLQVSSSDFFFFTFFGLDLLDIIFSIRKGDNWSNFVSCRDSIIMNLGKSLSVSELKSDKYLFDFLEGRSHDWCIFFIGPMLHHPPGSPSCVGNKPGGGPIHPGWDGDTLPVYSYQEQNSEPLPISGLLKSYNLTVVKTLLSTQLTFYPPAF